MDRVNVGMHVDIRRSDGRVHTAIISEVRKDTKTVKVEWFENGETKGKEIDLKSLLDINPMLAATLSTTTSVQSDRKLVSTESTTVPQFSSANQTNVVPRSATQPLKITAQKHRLTLQNFSTEVLNPVNGTYEADMVRTSLQQRSKLSTVQEIERLHRNREERRAQFKEVKKRKERIRSIDPGNPNWQFLTMIREYQSQIDFRPLKISDQVIDRRINVCVRKRPLNRKEIMKKEIEVITIPNRDHLIVHQPQVKVDLTKYLENQKFRFDYTFDENASNEMVYRFTAQPLVKTIFEQGFATCFAYGQTGSGKTHTMGGNFSGKAQDCSKGIYALTATDVFRTLSRDYKRSNINVYCSFFEIYGGKVFDLLGSRAMLRVLEDGKKEVQIVGLQEELVSEEDEVLDLIKRGNDLRTAGTTSANANSSRSHAVFQIILRKKSEKHGPERIWGKFSLIDLAGNERGVDTISSDRQTRMEGAEINKSLLALKECIRAMGKNSSHVPFRASKLTLVLRDSFVGANAKTCMIAMVSPGMSSCEHTLNTLRYADRVKELGAGEESNTPIVDEDLESANNDDDDFDLLQSRNCISDEAYRIQRTLQSVAKAEERSLDELSAILEEGEKVTLNMKSLLHRASKVDYDMEEFVVDLEKFATLQVEKFMGLKQAVQKWQTEMQQEMEICKKQSNRRTLMLGGLK